MAEPDKKAPPSEPSATAAPAGSGGPSRRRLIMLAGLGAAGIAAAGAGGYVVLGRSGGLSVGLGRGAAPAAAAAAKPVDVDIPEMTVTLPNGGHPRQLRIRLTLEVARPPQGPAAAILTPRLYDALVTYLRTLTDADLDGGLAIERLRGDLFRRVDLVLGPGVLRDVLITGLLVA